MTQPLVQAVLTPEDQAFFEQQGYLLVEDALPADVLAELNAATDALYARDADAGRLEKGGKLNMRNCIVEHPAFLQLLDWPTTVPLTWQLLGWNIQMLTSHLIVLPSGDEPAEDEKNKLGWHRDGGTSPREMSEPHPRILLKIAYALSDQTAPASGATWIVPGSNRLLGRPATDPTTGLPYGAQAMNIRAGSAFLFEQRTYHSIGHNWAGFPRKTVFFGYGYRWVKPMDYIAMPDELVSRCNPIQKQLIGVVGDPLSYYLPQDEDVPLKALVETEANQ